MTDVTRPRASVFPLGINTIGTIAAIAIVVLIVGPRSAVAVVVVLAALPYASVPWTQVTGVERRPPTLTLAVALFATYVLLSAAWSLAPRQVLYTVAIGSLVLAASWAAVAGLTLLPLERCQKLATAIIIGFSIGLVFLMVEELTDDAIKLFIFNKLPFTVRNPKHMILKESEILNVALYMSNRSMAVASFLLWPVLGMIAALATAPRLRWWRLAVSLALVAAAVTTVLKSQHETSAIALSLGAIVYLAAIASRRAAAALVVTGWVAAITLVIPAAHFAYDQLQLHKPGSLPFSARARVMIWKYTATQIPNAPIFGIGALSTEPLDLQRGKIETLADEPIPFRSGRHAHNIYLQVWYELGAVGAAILLLIGAAAIGAIRRLRPETQPYALATFSVAAAMAATSWSLWQEWFMASFGVTAACCWLVERMFVEAAGDTHVAGSEASDGNRLSATAASQ
jgi:O-antigen ligase